MVKKITVNCDFNGKSHPIDFYIGDSAKGKNPIGTQANWLNQERGGNVPSNLMESLDKIKKISDEHQIPFEILYDHVVKEMQNGKTLKDIEVSETKKIKKVAEKEIKKLKKDDKK